MKKSSHKKINNKYQALLNTIAKELKCVIHSTFSFSEKDNLVKINIETYKQKDVI